MSSKNINGVTYRVKTSSSQAQPIPNDSISTAKLQDGSVTEPKLASNAVSTIKLQNGSITEPKIADNAVTTDKIVNDAVTTDKIINEAVTSVKLETSLQTTIANAATSFIPVAASAIVTLTEARMQTIYADSSGGSFTLTMPAAPLDGDKVVIVDETGSWEANAVTVDMNSNNFLGNADTLLLNLNYNVVELIYYNGNYTVR